MRWKNLINPLPALWLNSLPEEMSMEYTLQRGFTLNKKTPR